MAFIFKRADAVMPYAWADLNGPGGFTKNGLADMTVRAGGRLYASPNVAMKALYGSVLPLSYWA